MLDKKLVIFGKNMIRRDEKSQQGMIGQEHDQKILEKSTGNDWSRTS
jgi:hypothetical protein